MDPSRQPSQPSRSAATASARDLLCPLRRAIELHLRGDYRAAEQRLRKALELEPKLPQAHHHLAVVLRSSGRTVEAVRHLALALDLDPHLVGARERLEAYHDELVAARDGESSLPSGGDEDDSHEAA